MRKHNDSFHLNLAKRLRNNQKVSFPENLWFTSLKGKEKGTHIHFLPVCSSLAWKSRESIRWTLGPGCKCASLPRTWQGSSRLVISCCRDAVAWPSAAAAQGIWTPSWNEDLRFDLRQSLTGNPWWCLSQKNIFLRYNLPLVHIM